MGYKTLNSHRNRQTEWMSSRKILKLSHINPQLHDQERIVSRNVAFHTHHRLNLVDENHKTVEFEADDQTTGVHVHKDWVLYDKLKNSGLGKRMDEFGNG